MAADLDLDLLVPDGRTITITVDGERRTFPLAGLPTLEEMIELMRRERALLDAFSSEDAEAIEQEVPRSLETVHKLICKLTPDAPEISAFELNTPQLLTMIRFLGGDDSVAEAVSRVLTGGEPKQLTAEELAELEANGETPLPLTQP